MKKKAQWGDIKKALITVLVIAVIGYLIIKFVLNPSSSIQTAVLNPQAKEMCKQEMDKAAQPADVDKDGYPDNIQRMGIWCDSCLGGDDNVDDDGDGIPDKCDKNPNTPRDGKTSIDKECTWDATSKRCTA
jgi:hypothetical protein